ncbi:helix-turn-helix domain-containing protein [Streptomyces albus subsp. chlorinus]|uniref:helix-turn-helix transcriptional regulator n=1 Tax=Streptomyces albus TaxID=1888 RepID=UPI001571336C|nr:helix-turn-helix domain-containing protein [Streptomyces albus]NSC22241.1 helix-turn-helix domain-containing protein [Streptomyces albus subsp. chlorinus]
MPPTSPRNSAPTSPRALASPKEVADYLGVPVPTLYQWKYRGIGPQVHKVGKHLRYRWVEVDAWLDRDMDLAS